MGIAHRQHHPATAVVSYIESLSQGRRVAVVGDATTGLAELLLERGARSVHVFDPDPARIASALATQLGERSHRPQLAEFTPHMGVRDGAFDLVIVSDLSIHPDAGEVVRRARRLVPATGAALFCAPNPEAIRWLFPPTASVGDSIKNAAVGSTPGYYELFDLVATEFSEVKMFGQAPFVGYSLVDFACEDPAVVVDTSLLAEAEVPEWFIAVGSDRSVELEPYAVVELSLADVARATFSSELSEPLTLRRDQQIGHQAGDSQLQAALAEAQAQVTQLATENQRMFRTIEASRKGTEEKQQEHASAVMRAAELERVFQEAETRAKEAERRAGDAHVRAEQKTHQIRDLEAELVRQRDRATKLSQQLEEERKARTKADVELGMARARPDLSDKQAQVERLTGELAASAARVSSLLSELDEVTGRGTSALARVTELEKQLATMTEQTFEFERASERNLGRIATLEAELSRAKAVDLRDDEDVDRLEAALLARGRDFAKMEADLRESDRIARELLREVMRAERPAVALPETNGTMAHTDELAELLARRVADLEAARWRTAALERELAARSPADRSTSERERDLERALVLAHREVAELRKKFDETGPASPIANA